MTLQVRRIVTGHDAAGKAIVATDERMIGTVRPGRAGIARCEIWSTDRMPVDNSDFSRGRAATGLRGPAQLRGIGTGDGGADH